MASWKASLGLGVVGLLAALLVPSPARATSVEDLPLPRLVREAGTIVQARVVKTLTTWGQHLERRAIVTQVVFGEAQALKGTAPATLQLFGGEVDGLRMTLVGQPKLAAGDDVLLFLHAEQVECPFVGVWQGVYQLRDGVVLREGRAVVDVVQGEVCLARDGEQPMSVGAFLDEVRRAIARSEREPRETPAKPGLCGTCPEERK